MNHGNSRRTLYNFLVFHKNFFSFTAIQYVNRKKKLKNNKFQIKFTELIKKISNAKIKTLKRMFHILNIF